MCRLDVLLLPEILRLDFQWQLLALLSTYSIIKTTGGMTFYIIYYRAYIFLHIFNINSLLFIYPVNIKYIKNSIQMSHLYICIYIY